jgi:molybdopterin-guanine dinucleotide biosynthesis protein B
MQVFGLAGWSGSGKTTMMERLLPAISARGISVSTIKHAHHAFDIDKPGKDSFRHREAGAREVMISSTNRWVLMHENRGDAEPTPDELLARMSPVDLVLIEGFKSWPHFKLEIHRRGVGDGVLCHQDPTIVAVASDHPIANLHIPVIDLADTETIVDFVLDYVGLTAQTEAGAA